MSWEDYKKYREDLKKKNKKLNIDVPTVGAVKNPAEKYTKDIKASITTKAKSNTNNVRLVSKDEVKNAKTYVPLWDKIKKMADDAGRIGENTYLGAKVGAKDMTNYMYETANSSLNSKMPFKEKQEKMNRVMTSKELTQKEKDTYLMIENAKQKNRVPINSNLELKPLLPTKQSEKIDYEKIEKVANKNAYLDSIKEDEKKIQENVEKQNSVVSKKLAELAPSIGNMSVGAVATSVNPIAGATYFGMSAGGSYMRDGLERGMSKEQAINYGTIMGILEGASEALGYKNFKKAGKMIKRVINGAGKELLEEGSERVAKDSLKEAFKKYGIGISDNFIQEALIEPAQELTALAVGGRDKADFTNMKDRMLEAGINGGLTGAIVGGADLGLSSCTAIIEKARNGQQVTQEEIQTAVKDASKELDVQKMIVDSAQQQVNKYKNNTQNLQQNATTEQNNISTQQINQENNKDAQNGISSLTSNNQERYIYEKTDNEKINHLREDVSKHWDNSEKTKNYVNMLEQIIKDKDIDIRLDANLTDSKGNIANGSYSNGVITINPNSNRKGEFIAIHELTHAIGTQQMINMANKYRKSNLEFNSAVETLLKNYKKSEITEESLADVAGQLFGNQEFINTLSQSNPTLFQKIYNEIKYLWHQFTGYKNQDQFIDDLRYKWEQAYRSNNMLNETTNYSIQRNNNGKYIKVDTDQDIFNGIEEKDYNKIAKMYMQDYLKGSTKLSESDNATIGNKGINKYTNPKQQTKYMNEKMKLTPELKNVLEIAEKVQDSPPTKDTSKYPNWEYYKFNFELGGKNFEGLINIGIDKNGNKHFYEINKIHTTSNSYVSTNKSSSTDSINNSILPTQENVNGTTNNSMQESENNSGSFNLPKIKEGYTRLYRGLENEYKANYDKSKLDNSNGYESWTDSYELAKAYGDNVYYIDVPTSEIKNSIIDEDNTSETYGDRNLLYKNDKPVGIKGKSGNEYMLYTDHDNYINLKYNKVNDNNSMQDNQGRNLSKKQTEYFKDSKVRDEKGNLLVVYHGSKNKFSVFDKSKIRTGITLSSNNGDGFYFTDSKKMVEEYAEIGEIYSVYLDIKNPFIVENNLSEEAKKLLIEFSQQTYNKHKVEESKKAFGKYEVFNPNEIGKRSGSAILGKVVTVYGDEFTQFLKNNGYDGIKASVTDYHNTGSKYDYIAFEPNQIKNIDNTNPTDNPDIRYSLPTKDWNKYLNKNFKTTGTTTNLNEIKLPTQKKSDKSQNTVMSNIKKYNKYKQNILNRRADEINSLISYKNESLRNIENKINEKQTLLNSKKNQNTKVATNIKSQIEKLKSQKAKIENLYNEKIDKVNKKTNKEKIDFETRNTMKQLARENLRAEISPLTEDLTKFKDKKKGILYKRETAQRNIEDIVQDKELAQVINDTIFNPIQKHHAEKTREINELFSTINDLKLDKNKVYDYVPKETGKSIKIDEATLAQLLIEKKMSKEDLKNKYKMSKEQIEKIDKTANTFSEILDYLYNKMNEEQIKFGYAPIGKIKNYFPHFFENKPDTMLGKIASYFGIDTTNQELPTEIAGITDTFKPGKTWNSNTLKRKTNKTDYDALKAMEKYIIGASDIIYTTEDIQRVREFEREIRYKYSDKGIQEQVDKIYNDKDLTQDAKEIAVKSILENTESELPNFVTWLNEYGNVLANKKSFSDRSMEQDLGRNMYSTMKGIEGRIASNTVGGNLSVSLTNFAPLFQSMGTTDFRYVLTGALQTTINDIKGLVGKKDIDFVNNSTFLTNRFGTNTISKQTITQNISNVASVPMNIVDAFTSESIVRAKYLENLDNGMTEEQALDNADKYASRLMADRSKGALPIVFNSKNPLSKLATMFQVEPNNIVSNYFKDMPKNADGTIDLTYQATKLMVASWAFNTIAMAVRGGNEVLPDPIRWVSYLIKSIFEDEEEEKEKAKKDLAESIIGSIPFASNIAGFGLNDLFGLDSDVGRIPVSNAMPSLTNIVKSIDKDANPEYRKELLTKELTKPLIYLGLPTGGAQLKKTVEGISTVYKGGSYKTDNKGNKKLQFPVENATAKDYIQAGVFGKYSLPVAKQYADRGFKTLSAKQTKTYQDAKLPYKEYIEYLDAGLKKTTDKIEYIKRKDMTIEQKWGIYKNDIFSDTERKDGGSQVKDAEYITSNGVSKEKYIELYNDAKKNNIDMPTENEYKDLKKKGISLKNYMNYKTQVKNKTKKKQKEENDEDTQLTSKEKMQILLDSKYSNKEKTALYEEQILSEQDTTYEVYKVIGMDINDYMKYKQQEFVSDKKDDGTLDGKSISGSRKKKFYNWVTSKNLPNTTYEQRLVITALEYKLTNSERTKTYNYIKSLGLSNKQNEKIFSKLNGFTVYKNGKVKW